MAFFAGTGLALAMMATVANPNAVDRPCNRWELMYTQVAIDAKAPEMCAKIDPGAFEGAGFNPAGYQTWYTRSSCYFELAAEMHDPSLCDRVRTRNVEPPSPELALFRLDGSAYSKDKCVAQARDPKARADFALTLMDELEAILRKMGYTEKDLPASVVRRNDYEEDTWREFYESIAETSEFRTRLSRLPTFGNGASEIPVPTCRAHEIVRGSLRCVDFDDDKICDDDQTATRGVTSADLKLGFVKDSPPALLCGNDPLRIAVRVSNVSQGKTIPKGAAWLELININPLEYGLSQADFRVGIPSVSPGEAVIVSFPTLRPAKPRTFGRGARTKIEPRVLLKGIQVVNFDPKNDPRYIDMYVDCADSASPRCIPAAR
jgi:hypothetical protein